MWFKYRAVSKTGQPIEGVYEAESSNDVVAMLKDKKYYPVSVEEKKVNENRNISFPKKISKKDMGVFCRQFYTMFNSGISIVKCLDILSIQTENKKLRLGLNSVCENVQEGLSISEAMKKEEKIFPSLLINMVEAGEVSGNLDTIMERMASHYEKENKIENKIKNAFIYPAVLSIVTIGVVIFLIVVVMPTFIGMFESNGALLPLPTRILLSISNSIKNFWYLYILIIGLAVGSLNAYKKTVSGKLFFDGLKIRLPIIKDFNIKVITSRFARTLSTLMSSGIPLIQSLDVVEKVLENSVISDKFEIVKENIKKGIPLSQTIDDTNIFSPMVVSMIKVGEESGSIDEILDKTADFYDEEVETSLQRMTTMLEPLLIVFMALIVGFIVIAMAMPMFDMVNTIKM
ncbi:type II secretion system F family protein [Sporanaerobacter sp. PP17-6a]|jgi:type IV pilus assembly protein PilC|uniref:type II secretion system F family protein n=1 Tax=Sporanaerobacter sp. PP17-6a TaxID=1891289 RepID=UPI0008A03345|nr:type II secretion system F family protein [Sporanaerobacter sp. PP17-6a]MBE6082571.1 type II secretion system F family protein [Tissierellaceae bacterium]SCL82238.1 General secretion pathway protein F [Sporanaerobacter sp. PP17-6a]